MNWNDASEVQPADARPCVVLVPSSHGFLEHQFGQFQNGRWHFMGSDQRLREVQFWIALPKRPEGVR